MEAEHSDRGIHDLASRSKKQQTQSDLDSMVGPRSLFKTMAGDNENAMPDRSNLRVKLIKTTND